MEGPPAIESGLQIKREELELVPDLYKLDPLRIVALLVVIPEVVVQLLDPAFIDVLLVTEPEIAFARYRLV